MTTVPYSNAQAVFYQQYEQARRDEVVGILLALFLGGFGIHHFYLRRTGWGIFYACFCWTPFPWILGFIECFFMVLGARSEAAPIRIYSREEKNVGFYAYFFEKDLRSC